jgi:hypothetical protein
MLQFDMDEKEEHPPAEGPDHPLAAQPNGRTSTSIGKLRRTCMLTAAGICFLLGALGAVLPILPTTPFLLLTSYFLARSSPKLNAVLLRSRFFGPILTDWQVHRGVRKDIKVKAVLVVVLTVGVSLYLTGTSLWPALGVVTLSLVGIGIVLRLPETN